jgi:hypothetical protein
VIAITKARIHSTFVYVAVTQEKVHEGWNSAAQPLPLSASVASKIKSRIDDPPQG